MLRPKLWLEVELSFPEFPLLVAVNQMDSILERLLLAVKQLWFDRWFSTQSGHW